MGLIKAILYGAIGATAGIFISRGVYKAFVIAGEDPDTWMGVQFLRLWFNVDAETASWALAAVSGLVVMLVIVVLLLARSPFRLSVDEGGKYFDTGGSGAYDIQRTYKVKVENVGGEKSITDCRLRVMDILPKEYPGPWLLKDNFSLPAGEHEFVPLVQYGEGRWPDVPSTTRYYGGNGFMTVLTTGLQPKPSAKVRHTIKVRATGANVRPRNLKCQVWVDERGMLRIKG